MTVEEIEKLPKEKLVEKLKAFYSNAESARAYLAIQKQIDNISNSLADLVIDLTSESGDKTFERFISFGQKLTGIEEAQIKRLSMLDEEVLRLERERRNSAKSGSLENFVNDGYMTKNGEKAV